MTKTTRTAINRNIDFIKDKQNVSNKINSDLHTLNWSLKESENKEDLQNKITTTLGIIIMLFACLCVGLMVYYMIKGGSPVLKNSKNKSNKGLLENIFGLGKKVTKESNTKKALSGIFS